MKGFTKKLEQMFTAITFAEAGEFETAEQIMKEETKDQEHSSTPVVPEGACFIAPGTKS
jgi:hypothetical protein